jgi:hypothetical protein
MREVRLLGQGVFGNVKAFGHLSRSSFSTRTGLIESLIRLHPADRWLLPRDADVGRSLPTVGRFAKRFRLWTIRAKLWSSG